jgi:hypothetical protein
MTTTTTTTTTTMTMMMTTMMISASFLLFILEAARALPAEVGAAPHAASSATVLVCSSARQVEEVEEVEVRQRNSRCCYLGC